jgi:SH3-like domain-containing protein
MRNSFFHFILACSCILLFSCEKKTERTPAIGEAYIGPVTLAIRVDISPSSKVLATLKHGEHVDILQTRRRFVRVRSATGIEGWTENRQLLTPDQIKQLRQFSERSLTLPSMGEATAYSQLNIHTEPNRLSPSFYLINQGVKLDVIGRTLAPRVATPPPVVKAAKPPSKQLSKKKSDSRKDGLLAIGKPPAPKPPSNWLELSQIVKPTEEELKAEEKKKEEAKLPPPPPVPVKMDDWNLVRTKDGKAGWVLSRMLSMAIPDDVAQYSEGAHITSYFSLGTVDDDGKPKHHWLWTTLKGTGDTYDFDSFRVFIYSLKKHRYETAYIERKVIGHYPVEAKAGSPPSFSLILEDDDGKLLHKTYSFEGYRVRLIGKEPWNPSAPTAPVQTSDAPPPPLHDSFENKLKNEFKKVLGK